MFTSDATEHSPILTQSPSTTNRQRCCAINLSSCPHSLSLPIRCSHALLPTPPASPCPTTTASPPQSPLPAKSSPITRACMHRYTIFIYLHLQPLHPLHLRTRTSHPFTVHTPCYLDHVAIQQPCTSRPTPPPYRPKPRHTINAIAPQMPNTPENTVTIHVQ